MNHLAVQQALSHCKSTTLQLERLKNRLSDSVTPWIYSPWTSPGQNTAVGSLSLRGIFPAQGSNPGLLHCRQILYQLSHQGSPKTLEWVAYPFSRDLPKPGINPGSPTLQADSLPAEPPGKPKNTGVDSLSLVQGIFPTQESNQGLLLCRQILYQDPYP